MIDYRVMLSMKVALFTDTYVPEVNGAAKALARWTDYLDANRIEWKVFAPADPRADVRAERGKIERFASIPFLFNSDSRVAIPNLLRIKRLVSEFQPTIIHVATAFSMGLCGRYFARKRNIPLIASYHTFWDQYLPDYYLGWAVPLQWKYMRQFHLPCAKVLVPSQSAKAYLARHGLERLDIWGRGVDTARFRPIPNRDEVLRSFAVEPEKFTILYVGRIAKEKNVDVLIEAYNKLDPEIRRQTQLLLVGGGPLLEQMKSDNRNPSIHYYGFVEGQPLYDIYAAADLFVFPSVTETFGNVVLEAMASGTPVIGADAGGVGEIIAHQETGLLCKPGDTDSFRQAMTVMIRDTALRERLASSGLELARRQSWASINAGLMQHYQGVIQERTASRSQDLR